MDVDPEVQGALAGMEECLARIVEHVQKPLDALDDETASSHYSLPEQAQLALASAFSLIMCFYSHQRLNNIPIDEQLELKMKRVAEYEKKVRQFFELDGAESAPKKARVDKGAVENVMKNVMSANARLSGVSGSGGEIHASH